VEISTRQFGKISVDEKKCITMPKGMPGFPEQKRYVLLDHDDIRPFHLFQSIDDADLAFIVMDPFLFKADYAVDIKPYIQEMAWDESDRDSLFIYVVVNATDPDPKRITANLMGPVLINIKKNEAVQMMISDGVYSHKYLIFKEKKESEDSGQQKDLKKTNK